MPNTAACLPMLMLALLTGCAHGASSAATGASAAAAQAASWWGAKPALKPGKQSGRIATDGLNTPFLKDPSFVAGGAPVGGARYIVFGDLRGFYLKAFDAGSPGSPLAFRAGQTRLTLTGLPAVLDAPWAPQIRVAGSRVELYYCAGSMPPPNGPNWSSFRLHLATAPLAAFDAALQAGSSPTFTDQGAILQDITPFGPGDQDFGIIDPCLFINRHGHAYMSYTVVREGVAGQRPHEELVRYRQVDPADVTRPLGPDTALYDGLAGSADDGVAEASDLVTLGNQNYAFISSRPGDTDQRLLVTAVGDELGTLDRTKVLPLLSPGGDDWRTQAVGSSSAAEINGTAYMVYQGLGRDQHFTLGWSTLAL